MIKYIADIAVPIIIMIIVTMGVIEKKNILELFGKRSSRRVAYNS